MSVKISLALVAFVTIAACCCSGLGGLLGGVEFTTGNFDDVPPYPGSTQTTDTVSELETVLSFLNLIPGEAEWKHYKTPDSESDILDWYEKVLPTHGWEEASAEDVGTTSYENSAFYAKEVGGDSVMLLVMVLPDVDDSGNNHIIIGRIVLETED